MNDFSPTHSSSGLAGTAFPLEKSAYYHRWLEEKEEIDKHKWYLSERAGHDVGYAYAQWSWLIHHRLDWLKERASGKA